jgi:para-nitrobenzyl esterase
VETAETAYKARAQANVPLIIGSNSAEVPAGFVNARSMEDLLSQFVSVKDEMRAAYDPDGATDFAMVLTMVNTDKVWAEPARFTARAFAAKGSPAYIYLFSYVSPRCREGCGLALLMHLKSLTCSTTLGIAMDPRWRSKTRKWPGS